MLIWFVAFFFREKTWPNLNDLKIISFQFKPWPCWGRKLLINAVTLGRWKLETPPRLSTFFVLRWLAHIFLCTKVLLQQRNSVENPPVLCAAPATAKPGYFFPCGCWIYQNTHTVIKTQAFWGADLSFGIDMLLKFQENPNIPLEQTPGPPKPPNERNSFIKCWLRVWGMLENS